MSHKIRFGTDGWRGEIAEDYTFDNVRRTAQGFAAYLLEQGYAGRWVIVGYDKRFHSENFAATTAEERLRSRASGKTAAANPAESDWSN